MKLLQVNTTVNSGSTGRIAEDIGKIFMAHGHESHIAFGRTARPSASKTIKIGSAASVNLHGLKTLLLDRHGFGSTQATRLFLKKVAGLRPDLVILHNIHGYYLNVETLFSYLKKHSIPTLWTLHDCWPFTGHCAHFDFVGCNKWQTHCQKCPLTQRYPKSIFVDNSYNNFDRKRAAFQGHPRLQLITPSRWLKAQVEKSFLTEYPVEVINNGIDLDVFRIMAGHNQYMPEKKIILGVASTWDRIKGLPDFIKLRSVLPASFHIVLLGLNKQQIKDLPAGITGIERTESQEQLVEWYNRADVFVNPTYVDNFPTTNLEALACGTPVITYNAGGSPESIDEHTGFVVNKGDVQGMLSAVRSVEQKDKLAYQNHCRRRAELNYKKDVRFQDYYQLAADFLKRS